MRRRQAAGRALLEALVAGVFVVSCAVLPKKPAVESPYQDVAALRPGQILHLPTGRVLTRDELSDYLAGHRVVYVGETHDSPADHAVELAILKGLVERLPGRVTLGLEMLRRSAQADADAWVRGDLDEEGLLRVWEENWSADSLPDYEEILRYVRAAKVPLLALRSDPDLEAAVREHDLAGLDPAVSSRLPAMDLEDPHGRAFLEAIFAGHPSGARAFESFHRVQVLRDETMAETAAAYLSRPEGRGRLLVIFAGGIHVRYGFGIPRRLFRRAPLPYVIVDAYAVEIGENRRDELMEVELPAMPMLPAHVYWAVRYGEPEAQGGASGTRR